MDTLILTDHHIVKHSYQIIQIRTNVNVKYRKLLENFYLQIYVNIYKYRNQNQPDKIGLINCYN